MSKNRVAGTAYIKVDGNQYSLAGSLTVSPDTVTREGLTGLSGVAGFKEQAKVPFIEGELYVTDELSLTALQEIKEATVTVELANGKTYVLSEAWTADARSLNVSEGTVSVRFEGMDAKEI